MHKICAWVLVGLLVALAGTAGCCTQPTAEPVDPVTGMSAGEMRIAGRIAGALLNLKRLMAAELRYEESHQRPPESLAALYDAYEIPDWYLGPLDGGDRRYTSDRGDDYNYKLVSFEQDGKWIWYAYAQPRQQDPDWNYFILFPSGSTYKPVGNWPVLDAAEVEKRAQAYLIAGMPREQKDWGVVK